MTTGSRFTENWREINAGRMPVVSADSYHSNRDGEVCGVRIKDSDAQLIAAAPDLLVACKAAHGVLGMIPSSDAWNPDDAADFFKGTYGAKLREKFNAAWSAIASSLAKAEGGQP